MRNLQKSANEPRALYQVALELPDHDENMWPMTSIKAVSYPLILNYERTTWVLTFYATLLRIQPGHGPLALHPLRNTQNSVTCQKPTENGYGYTSRTLEPHTRSAIGLRTPLTTAPAHRRRRLSGHTETGIRL